MHSGDNVQFALCQPFGQLREFLVALRDTGGHYCTNPVLNSGPKLL